MTSPLTLNDRWIVQRRPPRAKVDPLRPYAYFTENEYSRQGKVELVNTVFLTNRECPWRCLMCDLWKNTLTETVPDGAISTQIEYALSRLEPAATIKLYNSGSFFDPRAIPVLEYPSIARLLSNYERVIVESHPALIGENCFRFQELIAGTLEVAMGLETVHPEVLLKLNKHMTVEQFADSARVLRVHGIDLRTFILVKPPFLSEVESLRWACRSLDFAFDCEASAATLIPTRGGNGAMEHLSAAGDFTPPRIETVEAALEYGLRLARGRVFADLWNVDLMDKDKLAGCSTCFANRVLRLVGMNHRQEIGPRLDCPECEARA